MAPSVMDQPVGVVWRRAEDGHDQRGRQGREAAIRMTGSARYLTDGQRAPSTGATVELLTLLGRQRYA